MKDLGIKIAIAGAGGRMGQELINFIIRHGYGLYSLHSAFDKKDIDNIISPIKCIGKEIHVSDSPEKSITKADVLIDFTRPEASLSYLPICAKHNVAVILGTTGFDEAGKKAIHDFAKSNRIVHAANFSIGMNLTFKLLEIAARTLSSNYDIEIIEAHHRYKVDAPSGTALRMGEVIAKATNRNLNECAVYERNGNIGERNSQSIGFSTIRAGSIIGEHTAMFADISERIEISHKASERSVFASGALRAATWIINQQAGLYDMQDVLGLN